MAKTFRPGDLVEVCSKEEGFLGSYYAATVLAAGGTKVLVEYKTLLTSDESKWLREIINYKEVRPCPPEITVSAFHVFDEVDVYDNEGWWVGRITTVEGSNYSVFFSNCRQEITYPFSQLRVHQEWKNRKWVPSLSHH